jgi:hypothetical protein
MPSAELPYFEIRASIKHGSGAFALRDIPRRTRLIEYTGERISHAEADARPDVDDGHGSKHVLLFTVDKRTVIDARVGGNEAQYFNHSCQGNCEAVIDKRRVFLETIRDVAAGEELTYDYEMEYSGEDLETARREYPCRCGSPNCRGTLLDVPERLLKSAVARSEKAPTARRVTQPGAGRSAASGTKASPARSANGTRAARSRQPRSTVGSGTPPRRGRSRA